MKSEKPLAAFLIWRATFSFWCSIYRFINLYNIAVTTFKLWTRASPRANRSSEDSWKENMTILR